MGMLGRPGRRLHMQADTSLAEVGEAVAGDVLAGLSITAVRGAPGPARSTVLAAAAARLRAGNLRVVALVGGTAARPAAIAAALLAASNAGNTGPLASLDAHSSGASLGERLSGMLALPQMQELVLLLDDADALPGDTYRFVSLLLRLARDGTAKVRVVLFGSDAPWPELHRVRQDVWSTHILSGDTAPAGAPAQARRPARNQARRCWPGRWARPAWAAAGLTIAGCVGAAFLSYGAHFPDVGAFPARQSLPAPVPLAGPPVPPPPVPPSPSSVTYVRSESSVALPHSSPPDPSPPDSGSSGPGLPAPGPPTADLPPPPEVRPMPSHGLVFVARPGDTLAKLYNKLYRGRPMPPFSEVLALNPAPVRPGTLVTFPEPPGGWPTNEAGASDIH